MKRLYTYISLAILLILTGCYKEDVERLDQELTSLKEGEIASLQSQVAAINASVGTLDKVSSEVGSYITVLEATSKELQANILKVNSTLEATREALSKDMSNANANTIAQLENVKAALERELSNINAALDVLKAKDASLGSRIDSLHSYADGTFAAKSWVEATFATLEEQNRIIDDIAAIKAQISSMSAAITKAEEEIKQLVENKIAIISKDLDAQLAQKVSELVESYSSAISKAKEELDAAYTQELADAITQSEEKLLSWVNDKLKDYWTIAEADAQREALLQMLGNIPDGENLYQELLDLGSSLEKAKEDITAAYKELISSAITESAGKMTSGMELQINALRTDVIAPIKEKVGQMEDAVKDLQDKVWAIDGRIAELEDQIQSMLSSIDDMTSMQETLEEYIASVKAALEKTDKDNYDLVSGRLDSLNKVSTDLESHINALKSYIGTLPSDATQATISEWISATITTLQKQYESYYTISQVDEIISEINVLLGNINADIEGQRRKIEALYTTLLSDIDSLRTELKGWVNEQLTLYTTTAELRSKLNSLNSDITALFTAKDDEMLLQIAFLASALTTAQSDLEAAYTEAIKQAIEAEGGYVTATIKAAYKDVTDKIEALGKQTDDITADIAQLKERMTAAEEAIAALRGSIIELDESFSSLIKDYEGQQLKDLVDEINSTIDDFNKDLGESSQKINELWEQLCGKGGIREQVTELLDMERQLKAAQDNISSLQDMVGTYRFDSTLEDLIGQLQEGINARIDSASFNALKAHVDSLCDLNGRITCLEEAIPLIDRQVDSLLRFAGDIDGKTLSDLVSSLESEIAKCAKQTSLDKVKERVDALTKSSSEIIARLDTAKSDIDDLTSKAAQIVSDTLDLGALVRTLQASLASVVENESKDYSALISSLGKMASTIDSLDHKLDSAINWIVKLEGDKTSYISSSANLKSIIENLQKQLDEAVSNTDTNTGNISSLATAISDLSGQVAKAAQGLSDAFTSLEALFKTNSNARDSVRIVSDMIAALQKKLEDYALITDFDKLRDSIEKFIPTIEKFNTLAQNIASAQSELNDINSFVTGYGEDDTLKALLDEINSAVDSLSKAGISAEESLDSQIKNLMNLLYGSEDGSSTTLASILGRITAIEKKIAAKALTSIAYIPVSTDGTAKVSAGGSLSFDFDVRPGFLAKILCESSGCRMRYKASNMIGASASTEAIKDFTGTQLRSYNGSTLNITVSLSNEERASFADGASAAIFVNIAATDSTQTINYAGKFIPIYADDIFRTDPASLSFDCNGGSKNVTVYPSDGKWSASSSDPTWITVDRQSNALMKVSVAASNDTSDRTGHVVVKYGDRTKFVSITQTRNPNSQKLEFNPASLELTLDNSSKSVTVSTINNSSSDWWVDLNNTSGFLYVDETAKNSDSRITVSTDDFSTRRNGSVRFVSASGVKYDYPVSIVDANDIKSIYPNPLTLSSSGNYYYTGDGNWEEITNQSNNQSSRYQNLTVTTYNSNTNWTITNGPAHYTATKDNNNIKLSNIASVEDWNSDMIQDNVTIMQEDSKDTKTVSISQCRPFAIDVPGEKNASSTFTISIKCDTEWWISSHNNIDCYSSDGTHLYDKMHVKGSDTVTLVANGGFFTLRTIAFYDGLNTKSIWIVMGVDGYYSIEFK